MEGNFVARLGVEVEKWKITPPPLFVKLLKENQVGLRKSNQKGCALTEEEKSLLWLPIKTRRQEFVYEKIKFYIQSKFQYCENYVRTRRVAEKEITAAFKKTMLFWRYVVLAGVYEVSDFETKKSSKVNLTN